MEESPGKLRTLLVDDHMMFREALAEILDQQPDVRVAGSVSSVSQAIEFLSSQDCDVVLLDYDLGGELAFDLLDRMAELDLRVPVLILSAGMNGVAARRLHSSGISAILSKQVSLRELTGAIRRVASEGHEPSSRRSMTPAVQAAEPWLTKRQQQVARSVLNGDATKEIAATLGVSEGSVKCTLQQLFAKTTTRSRSQLVRVLLERYPDHVLNSTFPDDITPAPDEIRPAADLGALDVEEIHVQEILVNGGFGDAVKRVPRCPPQRNSSFVPARQPAHRLEWAQGRRPYRSDADRVSSGTFR